MSDSVGLIYKEGASLFQVSTASCTWFDCSCWLQTRLFRSTGHKSLWLEQYIKHAVGWGSVGCPHKNCSFVFVYLCLLFCTLESMGSQPFLGDEIL